MTFAHRPHIAVIGGGPAGLMAAEVAAAAGAATTLFERMPTVGRKLLMAGRGGLNLTHSEDMAAFMARYGASRTRLEPAIAALPPDALRAWAEGLGQKTFVGSSGRVFPRAMKASPLLRAWLVRLAALGARIETRAEWTGWAPDGTANVTPLISRRGRKAAPVAVDAVILALGGASWPRLGANGDWTGALAADGVPVAPLRAANCGFEIAWSDHFRNRFHGAPLKTIALEFGGRRVRGEAVITTAGIEGGAVYALSAPLRESIAARGAVTARLDLRPDVEHTALTVRLSALRKGESLANRLRKAAKLSPAAAGLLREGAGGPPPADPAALAALIKAVPLRLIAPQPIMWAISSTGGAQWAGIDDRWMLRARPGVFVAGEMIDWEAPTGGYLLQACFATGAAAARGALVRLTGEDASRAV